MVFEGYLKIGSTEIVNSERIRGFAASSDCYLSWLQGPKCESLQDALGDEPYEMSNMPLAPWFDQSLPDLSGRFLGVYGLSISGLNSSTRSADSTEGIADGGTLGRTRKGMMSARVRATLLAKGRDALDYGVSWLNTALDPDACGQHGSGCGTTDMEFLTDCPPEREQIVKATEVRRNLTNRPTPIESTDWYVTADDGVNELDPEFTRRPGVASLRRTATTSTPTLMPSTTMLAPGGTWLTDGIPVVAGETYTVSAYTSGSVADYRSQIFLTWADSDGNFLAAMNGDFTTGGVVGEWQRPHITAEAPAGAAYLLPGVGVSTGSGLAPSGSQGWATDALVEVGDEVGEWFSGALAPPDSDHDYAWLDEPNASESVMYLLEDRPQNDEEYAVDVDELRRFLHDVAVTSGPLVVEEHVFRRPKGYFGLTMEWTITSERAWIYSKTRPVELPVTPTVVMQDVAYNLATHPSAELASDPVVVATNYSTNPSVETNGTGWFAYAEGPMDAPGVVASGRVVGELAAAGTASYRAVFTAAGAGSGGAMGVDHTVSISSRPSRSRVSISYWAAELLMSGTPVREPIEFQALWRSVNDGNVPPLRTDILGTAPVDGGFVSAKSLEPPAGANFLTIRALARVTSWPAGTVLRLYADAAAVTIP